jgi:deoxyhypusine synthase
MTDYLAQPTVPLEIDPQDNVAELLEKMKKTSFQSRNLATALSIWNDMLQDKVLIFLGLAGAMSAAGMRRVVSYLIENHFVDCVVSTGANLFHDMHESLGRHHFIGHHQVNDVELQEKGIDRIYDTYAKEREFRNLDHMIGEFSQTLDLKRLYSTREFFYLLGEKIWSRGRQKGIVTSA